MRITKAQEALLDSFVCQRLSACPENKRLIRKFRCARNPGLADHLCSHAWADDVSGSVAFYVIKNQKGQIMMYFSLKCGMLFNPLNEAELRHRHAIMRAELERFRAYMRGATGVRLTEKMEEFRQSHGFTVSALHTGVSNKAKKLSALQEDDQTEPNRKIVRVEHTYPGIELVHFCVNDNARGFWKACGMGHSMGEVFFWKFVAPLICSVQNIIGCRYTYLFAADASRDGTLLNYYKVALNFEQPDELGTNKPLYDLSCVFMCQPIGALREQRELYFAHFNPDPDEWV